MFFSGWEGLFRTLVVGILAYVAMVVFLRVSGKRTLSKMNAFDLILTVALGSNLQREPRAHLAPSLCERIAAACA